MVALAVVGGLTAGCREDSRSQSPTAPSAATSTISGTLVAGTGTARIRPLDVGGPLVGVTVTVVQTGQTTQTDATGNFALSKVPAGAVQLEFERADIHASLNLEVPAGSTVTLTIAVSGTTAAIVSHDSSTEIKGTILTINTNSFVVSTTSGPVTVKTDASTVFRAEHDRAASFADLKIGARVEVKGTLRTDGSILARKVEIKD